MNLPFEATYIWSVSTPIMLALLAAGALLFDMTIWMKSPRSTGVFVLIGLVLTMLMQAVLQSGSLLQEYVPLLAFLGEVNLDLYSSFFNYIFLITAAVTVVYSFSFFQDAGEEKGEYYILIVFAAAGMSLMACAADLMLFFIGLEIMSISVYVMIGAQRKSLKAGEASLKYLVLGAFSSGILLYGMALLYGFAGSIDYRSITAPFYYAIEGFADNQRDNEAVPVTLVANLRFGLIGVGLMLAGLFFKVAAVPFHMWTPDVYEGAPTPVTGFMAAGVKAAAFAALLRLLMVAWQPLWGEQAVYSILSAVAIATMILGNLTAIAQRNVKRMLAYSSIAHAGYLLIGVTALVAAGQFFTAFDMNDETGEKLAVINTYSTSFLSVHSVVYYLVVYAVMNLGAFGVLIVLGREKNGGDTLDGLSGVAARRPLLAGLMAVFMLSLAGIPPLAGFTAKFAVFKAAIHTRLYILAIIGVLNSALAAYYYLRVLVAMYMDKEKEPFTSAPRFSGAIYLTVVMAALIIIMGLLPNQLYALVSELTKQGISGMMYTVR